MISKGYYHIIASNRIDYCNGLYHTRNNEHIHIDKTYLHTIKKRSLFGIMLWIIFHIIIRDDKK